MILPTGLLNHIGFLKKGCQNYPKGLVYRIPPEDSSKGFHPEDSSKDSSGGVLQGLLPRLSGGLLHKTSSNTC